MTSELGARRREGSAPTTRLVVALCAGGLMLGGLMMAPATARPAASDRLPTSARPPASARAAQDRPVRYIAVSAATVWTRPGPKRAVDAPALAYPAHPRQWVETMTVAQKRWLSATGAVQTQALLGTRVSVLDTSGIWTKIAVSTQSTPKESLGYPGWVPTRQLTMTPPRQAERIAVVRARTAWLWNHWSAGGVGGEPVLELSYDTRLPVVKVAPNYVEVVTMTGRHRAVRRSLVAVHTVGTPWHPSAAQVVTEARRFVGLNYLWGGTSGFGYDCSGFTYSLYHRIGKASRVMPAPRPRAAPRCPSPTSDPATCSSSPGRPVRSSTW